MVANAVVDEVEVVRNDDTRIGSPWANDAVPPSRVRLLSRFQSTLSPRFLATQVNAHTFRSARHMTYCECCGERIHSGSNRRAHRANIRRDAEDDYAYVPRKDDLVYQPTQNERTLENFIRSALEDEDHPEGVAMNRSLVTVFVMRFTPNPMMDSFKLDVRLDETKACVTYQNIKRRKFLRRATDWGPLAFGQTSIIVRNFYNKVDELPFKRVRGYVLWSKGKCVGSSSGALQVPRAGLVLSYSMSPPSPEERVEFVDDYDEAQLRIASIAA